MNEKNGKATGRHRQILRRIARRAMIERGFRPDFPAEVRDEPASLKPEQGISALRDLRGLPWCSIDNDDSRDLDQLTCARHDGGAATVLKIHMRIEGTARMCYCIIV